MVRYYSSVATAAGRCHRYTDTLAACGERRRPAAMSQLDAITGLTYRILYDVVPAGTMTHAYATNRQADGACNQAEMLWHGDCAPAVAAQSLITGSSCHPWSLMVTRPAALVSRSPGIASALCGGLASAS
jgi:hypothetical protein